MLAIGATRNLPVDHPDFLIPFDAPLPEPGRNDILVRVRAIGINPVDTKIRKSLGEGPHDPPRILGWDAAGVVEAVGAEATEKFIPGDEVYYAGDLTRPGCNAEFQCVDARLAAHKPKSRDFTAAAALPLCTLTAWELLFERMGVTETSTTDAPLLVINGAGGVGSALIPLARHAGLEVVATASRAESLAWCESLGANVVINHHQPLRQQCEALGYREFPWIANLFDPAVHWTQTAGLLALFGTLGLIVEPSAPLHLGDPLKAKCARIAWEFMAARAKFQSADLARQGEILTKAAAMHDAGNLPAIHTNVLQGLTVNNLRVAYTAMENATAIGKTVINLI
ncbi:MAG: zinc-binding alcohol dehydrogenase family protein [Luteolibacter sp.]|jgi:NADPH:quinone reductase